MTLDEMHRVLDDMMGFLTRENILLEQMDTEKVLSLLDEKTRHIARYEQLTAYIKCNNATIKALPKEIKTQLFDKVQNLHAVVEENEKKVSIVKTAGDYFLMHLAKLTQKATKPVEGYTALGGYSKINRHMGGVPVSLSLNQSF